MKHIFISTIFALTFFIFGYGRGEAEVPPPDLKTILPGPATEVLDLFQGLEEDIRVKMESFSPRLGGPLENAAKGLLGGKPVSYESVTGALDGVDQWFKNQLTDINSQQFIDKVVDVMKRFFIFLIDLTKRAVDAL